MTTIINLFSDIIYNYQHSRINYPYDEIKYLANRWNSKYGCEEMNHMLDDILKDRRCARLLMHTKTRYVLPIYKIHNTPYDSINQDEYVKRSELLDIYKQISFKEFIDNIKCHCDKHYK